MFNQTSCSVSLSLGLNFRRNRKWLKNIQMWMQTWTSALVTCNSLPISHIWKVLKVLSKRSQSAFYYQIVNSVSSWKVFPRLSLRRTLPPRQTAHLDYIFFITSTTTRPPGSRRKLRFSHLRLLLKSKNLILSRKLINVIFCEGIIMRWLRQIISFSNITKVALIKPRCNKLMFIKTGKPDPVFGGWWWWY